MGCTLFEMEIVMIKVINTINILTQIDKFITNSILVSAQENGDKKY